MRRSGTARLMASSTAQNAAAIAACEPSMPAMIGFIVHTPLRGFPEPTGGIVSVPDHPAVEYVVRILTRRGQARSRLGESIYIDQPCEVAWRDDADHLPPVDDQRPATVTGCCQPLDQRAQRLARCRGRHALQRDSNLTHAGNGAPVGHNFAQLPQRDQSYDRAIPVGNRVRRVTVTEQIALDEFLPR